MILLDTHALLWWALDPGQLSRPAADLCARMEREGGFASSISVWEIGIKVKRGKLDMGLSVDEFVQGLERSSVVELLPVDTATWLHSLSLPWDHRDPVDRVIVATARMRGLPVLTRDSLLQASGLVPCRW